MSQTENPEGRTPAPTGTQQLFNKYLCNEYLDLTHVTAQSFPIAIVGINVSVTSSLNCPRSLRVKQEGRGQGTTFERMT